MARMFNEYGYLTMMDEGEVLERVEEALDADGIEWTIYTDGFDYYYA